MIRASFSRSVGPLRQGETLLCVSAVESAAGMLSPLVLLQIYTQSQAQPFWAFFAMSLLMIASTGVVWPVPRILTEKREDKLGIDGLYSPYTRVLLADPISPSV